MSGPKSYTIVEDPEAVRRRAEELRRREQELYDSLRGTNREDLNEEDFALCERVEHRERAIDALNRQSCDLLRARATAMNARIEQATRARAALLDQDDAFRAPSVPSAIGSATMSRTDPEALQAAIDAVDLALKAYEADFTRARQAYLARRNSGSLGTAAARAVGVSCYSSELQSIADNLEQRVSGERRADLQRQRSDADEVVLNATKNLGIDLSAEAMECYRELLACEDVGARNICLAALRHHAREDIARHRAATKEMARLEAERLAIDKRAVLADVCRQMGWRVIMGNGPDADRIYVAEKGFANHLRELRLEQDRDGATRLSIEPREIEGATKRVPDKARLESQHREFNLALCGKDGSLGQFKDLLRSNAIGLEGVRRDAPPPRPPVALANLPPDIRDQLAGTTREPGPVLQAPIPRK